MYKRIIALAAAVLMLIGSTQIPQASNGEPVRQEEQHDRTASIISESSTDDPGIKEIPEPADQPARGTYGPEAVKEALKKMEQSNLEQIADQIAHQLTELNRSQKDIVKMLQLIAGRLR